MPSPVQLFRLEIYRHGPQAHDALCRGAERELRDSGAFDHLAAAPRREALAAAVAARHPWSAQKSGWLQTELREGKFYADYFMVEAGKPPRYCESFELGAIGDAPELLRQAFAALPALVADRLAPGAHVDDEPYLILVERFDFRRFCGDHRLPAPALAAERARKWN